jgi:multicomponent Na+:H+ antiporter subunit G
VVGAGLVLLAVALAAFDGAVSFRAIAGIVFLILTTPVSAHLLARAAHLSGQKPHSSIRLNEMSRNLDNRS